MISITPMTRYPLPDQRKIYRPAAICVAKGNLGLQKMPTPIDGPIGASPQIKGINKTKRLLLFLLSVTNFHHFPKDSLLS
jgi:hypothetical protein